MKNKISLLGVSFSTLTEREVLEYVVKNLRISSKKYYIVTPNPEILTIANEDPSYKRTLNHAELALPDGIGVIIAGKVLGIRLKRRITGVDLMESICNVISKQPITVGFLGAKEGIADKTAECLKKRYPGLKVSFTASELDDLTFRSHFQLDDLQLDASRESSSQSQASVANIKSSGVPIQDSSFVNVPRTDILFVAFGSPKQEFWMEKNIDKMPVRVIIGVGGAFDFISGEIKRAPTLFRKIGLEWLFRLILQPWRIKRQVSLIKFIFLVLGERFKSDNINREDR